MILEHCIARFEIGIGLLAQRLAHHVCKIIHVLGYFKNMCAKLV